MILRKISMFFKKGNLAAGIVLLALGIFFMMSKPVYAVSTDKAVEPIDADKDCSLTLTYGDDEKTFGGMEINLYRVADISENYEFTITERFNAENFNFSGIKNQEAWAEVIGTLNSYITGWGVAFDQQEITDEKGKVHFNDLKPGVYFVKWTHNNAGEKISGFEPSLITVPSMDSQDMWDYDVEAYPKSGGSEKDKILYTVSKLWNDIGYEEKRPESIDVNIYKNGKIDRTVTLDKECNWVYTWETKDVDAEWVCVEKKVPAKYVMTADKRENNFVIINSISGGGTEEDNPPEYDDPDKPDNPAGNEDTPGGRTGGNPNTGDTMKLWKYLTILCISVIALLLVSAYVILARINEH